MEPSEIVSGFSYAHLKEKGGLLITSHKKLEGYESQNFLLNSSSKEKFVLKIYEDFDSLPIIQAENELLLTLAKIKGLNLPTPIKLQNSFIQHEQNFYYRILTFLEGNAWSQIEPTIELIKEFGHTTALLNLSCKNTEIMAIHNRRISWDLKHAMDCKPMLKYIDNPSQKKLVDYFLDRFQHYCLPVLNKLPNQIIHSDLNDWNVFYSEEAQDLSIIDFGDVCCSPKICEVAIALCYLLMGKEDPIEVARHFVSSYHQIYPLTATELDVLYDLIAARLCVSVCHSAKAKAGAKDTSYILISEKPAWKLLEDWIKISPVKAKKVFYAACGLEMSPYPFLSVEQKRKKYFSSALSLSYQQPIHFKSSAFQYLYDQSGNTFLDAYNNIPLVGHCHPEISRRLSEQVRTLNTNTRYHYIQLGNYAEKLLSKFPQTLNHVFFVNSGSAAADLARRLAENYTGFKNHIVLENGYHGNGISSIELSHYKFSKKGGQGQSKNILTLPLPKAYLGKFDSAQEYVSDAIDKMTAQIHVENKGFGSFIAEPISGCGGQVPLMDGYLKQVDAFLKKENILLIVDEVQTGFGRLGAFFWGFEMHNIVPDIVILGKAMGNGHPLAAVVCTKEIAEAFDNGMEFFSSFGGNPVSCTVGEAVLDILLEEKLPQNAAAVGKYWKDRLEQVKTAHQFIGDVRGQGLFLGVECIDPKSLGPSPLLAIKIKNALRQRFILSSTDGPHNNVIKVKPPLCFTKDNVDSFMEAFAEIVS